MNTALLLVTLLAALPALSAAKPNVLIILTDDQGWPTLGCYGSQKVPTPHLDSLARDGIRFTDAYVMPQCTPTRAALLTGQHTARTGLWHVIPWYGYPWARMREPAFREQLPRDWMTLPKAFRAAGYRTGMAGKWHLTTNEDGDYVQLKAGDAHGFDEVAPRGPGSQNTGDKWVDHLTDQTIRFIESERSQPWFFYLAHHTLHGQVAAPAALIQKHREAGAPETGHFNATYLAAIEHLDASVGRLLAALDASGQRDHTLILFLSDNGGVDELLAPPSTIGAPVDGQAPLALKAREFDNAPLRAGKGSPYEGGLRVPCLLRWPARFTGGQVVRTPVHVIDWMPTLLAAADLPTPPDQDGCNLLPMLEGAPAAQRPLFFYLPLYDLRWPCTPCAVMREGDWKLIEFFGDAFVDSPAGPRYVVGHRQELYNLRQDLGETQNLAASETERVRGMSERLQAWLQSVAAPIPERNPREDPARWFEETKIKQAWNP